MNGILVIDDDPTILDLVREYLMDEGYRVTTATTLPGALDRLARDRYGVILADTLHDPDGPAPWAGLGRLRTAAPGAPVVIVSAHSPALFGGWRERGYGDLLPKPFDLDDLLARVRAHLAGGCEVVRGA